MSNIQLLKRQALSARLCGMDYGADALPLRQDDPASAPAEAPREAETPTNACPFRDPACIDMCMRPAVCGNEP